MEYSPCFGSPGSPKRNRAPPGVGHRTWWHHLALRARPADALHLGRRSNPFSFSEEVLSPFAEIWREVSGYLYLDVHMMHLDVRQVLS